MKTGLALGAAVLAAVGIAAVVVMLMPDREDPDALPSLTRQPATPSEAPVGECPAATVTVESAIQLHEALDGAEPGDVIVLEPGTYQGEFVATTDGTESDPVVLCGPREAELVGPGPDDAYGLHLDGADYWRVSGFTVRDSQKGVMVDNGHHNVIEGLDVHSIGDEAIHLRSFSSDNVVRGNEVHDTGLRKPKYGEGIYVGTAESNWCDISGCEPDNSDRNLIEANTIYDVSAEAVDIKEGTSDGILRDNDFDGAGASDEVDSWVDVKGNDWLIEGNRGVNAPLDGFQTHEILDGWGTGNMFRGNVATVDADGYGFSLTPERDNSVSCDNEVSGAGEGFSNAQCREG
ncbi:right-handed parallel beta-helix repeat-containing protein [Demequina sp. TTPB684]|uniref:right-handed parallel beta-helix repeat-containing protein n=1 Tax=unclassified Demequina TaxID=2620311 RepID=UPI001CF14E6E|nr:MULTISPECIES: right-handed parallel beta-helix repeat-containing protein [unclassified Demequina]MCB2413293.1 right-handed parallel beta-helix repeat-containing protein [Demequina sp. TTPB684]UPU88987.1 right-handed parallel beta-helix repeat-containing protein [Demequina sp. TMPB413]